MSIILALMVTFTIQHLRLRRETEAAKRTDSRQIIEYNRLDYPSQGSTAREIKKENNDMRGITPYDTTGSGGMTVSTVRPLEVS